MDRLKAVIREILIAVDQVLQTIICGAFHLIGLAPMPNADETISGIVGRRAYDGARWAIVSAVVIDTISEALGEEPGHCFRSRGK